MRRLVCCEPSSSIYAVRVALVRAVPTSQPCRFCKARLRAVYLVLRGAVIALELGNIALGLTCAAFDQGIDGTKENIAVVHFALQVSAV